MTNPTVVIEQELGKSIKIIEGLGPGVSGRYEVNVDNTSLVIDDQGVVSTAYSVVFVDKEDVASSTIFSHHLTPAVSDPRLINKPYKIYRTPSGSAYIYDVDPVTGIGAYLPLGQATIREWRTSGVTNTFDLPYQPSGNIMLFINGTLYDDQVYSISGVTVSWSGSFPIEPSDSIKIFFL